MTCALTIVMYHYVRPIAGSPYPNIRGREISDFIGQLDYIGRHYTVVTAQHVVAAIRDGTALPPMALLLTFDDGYADHYHHVLPQLVKREWTAMFFVPARAVTHGAMLDVNKIHFLLASAAPLPAMIERVERAVQDNKDAYGLKEISAYRAEYKIAGRFDTAEVIYLKRMLQTALPRRLREKIADELFGEFVGSDSLSFARELYMTTQHLREMQAAGMIIGGHGSNHGWLNRMTAEEQAADIDDSFAMLEAVGVPKPVTFCYPYGGYNEDTLTLLETRDCALAVTTQVGLADMAKPLELARLDTNDLPVTADAGEAAWTKRARYGIEAL